MIRPVCIKYTNFSHGRITLFLIVEILLDVKEILKGHSKTKGIIERLQIFLIHLGKAFQNFYIFWLWMYHVQCLRNFLRCFS